MERRAISLELKAGKRGEVEGYASRFGEKDQGNDIVQKGAFSESLKMRMPKMLWDHNASEPIGVWDEVSEDDTGLYVKGRVMEGIAKGREVLEMLRNSVIDGMSIGYRTVESERDQKGDRLLQKLELWEVSMVTFPMLLSARVDAVKAAEMTKRDMELLLTQDAGLSRSVARQLMAGGFEAIQSKQDAGGDELSKLRDALCARSKL